MMPARKQPWWSRFRNSFPPRDPDVIHAPLSREIRDNKVSRRREHIRERFDEAWQEYNDALEEIRQRTRAGEP
jgi:hypothetical protein